MDSDHFFLALFLFELFFFPLLLLLALLLLHQVSLLEEVALPNGEFLVLLRFLDRLQVVVLILYFSNPLLLQFCHNLRVEQPLLHLLFELPQLVVDQRTSLSPLVSHHHRAGKPVSLALALTGRKLALVLVSRDVVLIVGV